MPTVTPAVQAIQLRYRFLILHPPKAMLLIDNPAPRPVHFQPHIPSASTPPLVPAPVFVPMRELLLSSVVIAEARTGAAPAPRLNTVYTQEPAVKEAIVIFLSQHSSSPQWWLLWVPVTKDVNASAFNSFNIGHLRLGVT